MIQPQKARSHVPGECGLGLLGLSLRGFAVWVVALQAAHDDHSRWRGRDVVVRPRWSPLLCRVVVDLDWRLLRFCRTVFHTFGCVCHIPVPRIIRSQGDQIAKFGSFAWLVKLFSNKFHSTARFDSVGLANRLVRSDDSLSSPWQLTLISSLLAGHFVNRKLLRVSILAP